jgi:hypothetical protein
MVYDWKTAPPFDPIAQATFIAAMQQALRPYLRA